MADQMTAEQREARIQELITELAVTRDRAEFMLAVELGEIDDSLIDA